MFEEIAEKIMKTDRIAIVTHASPDGDAVGSTMALVLALRKHGKDVEILSKEPAPENLSYLPLFEEYGASATLSGDRELLLALDCGNKDRLSMERDGFEEIYKINIDHHVSNDLYGDYNFVDTNSSAVGEIVYQVLQLLGLSITKEVATCLYTSLITDSGSFKYSSTTSVTHTIAGDLINAGIDFSTIHRLIFENAKFERVKLYGKVIESMELHHNGELCYMELTKKMLEDCGVEAQDTSDIIAIGTSVASAEVVALLKETDNGIKVSLRSKNKVDVQMVAGFFSGGGHTRAAGLSIDKSLADAKDIIINALEKEL